MSAKRGKRSAKVPKTFKDYVTADEEGRLMVEEEEWLLVQFEDEGQVYCALPKEKVMPIALEDTDDDSMEISEGDYIDAIWPGDGKPYDAKVIQIGTKTDMRVLRVQLERERKHLESLEVKEKEKEGKNKLPSTVKQNPPKKTEQKKKEEKHQGKSEKLKKKEDQHVQDQEKREKLKKKEEATAKRLEMQQKRKAELEQARENVKEFSRPDDVVISSEPLAKKKATSDANNYSTSHSSDNEIMERLKFLMKENEQLKEMAKLRTEEKHSEKEQEYEEDIMPGVLSPEKARISKMVPLLPGSFVYLSQEQKNAAYNSKPTILVGNLMRVFFNDQTLKRSNYGRGGPRGYNQLNPRITKAIIGYVMDPSIIKKEDMVSQSKLTETMNKMCNEARRGISKISLE